MCFRYTTTMLSRWCVLLKEDLNLSILRVRYSLIPSPMFPLNFVALLCRSRHCQDVLTQGLIRFVSWNHGSCRCTTKTLLCFGFAPACTDSQWVRYFVHNLVCHRNAEPNGRIWTTGTLSLRGTSCREMDYETCASTQLETWSPLWIRCSLNLFYSSSLHERQQFVNACWPLLKVYSGKAFLTC